MVKPDIIITIPYGMDSPYLRFIYQEYKDLFNKLIIGQYNDHRKYDFRDFLKEQMSDAIFVDVKEAGSEDWRNKTVNSCLKKSKNNWVLFLEDDFLFNRNILTRILTEAEDHDVAGYGDMGEWSGEIRLHPAFILCKRSLIDKTRKDFGAHPENNRDHFGTFTEDLFNLKNIKYLNIDGYGWEHLKGTYSNYFLVLEGKEPNYEPKKFREYVAMTIQLPIKWDSRFKEWTEKCLTS